MPFDEHRGAGGRRAMSETPRAAMVSIKIGDGAPDVTLDVLIHDLEHMTHEDAIDHYGDQGPGCLFMPFSDETTQGRTRFVDLMDDWDVPADERAAYLAEWDGCQRPVAIVHYWRFDDPKAVLN